MPRVNPAAEPSPEGWRELDLLTRKEVASILRVDIQAIDKLRRAGKLLDVKVGPLVRITTRSVQEMLGELAPTQELAPKLEPPPRPRAKLDRRLQGMLDEALRIAEGELDPRDCTRSARKPWTKRERRREPGPSLRRQS